MAVLLFIIFLKQVQGFVASISLRRHIHMVLPTTGGGVYDKKKKLPSICQPQCHSVRDEVRQVSFAGQLILLGQCIVLIMDSFDSFDV